MKWKRHNTGPIGIDIGGASVRAMQLRWRGDTPEILAAAEVPLNPADTQDSQDSDTLRSAVRKVLTKAAFAGQYAATTLPAEIVELRSLRLPSMPLADLEPAAMFEAQERFPSWRDEFEIRVLPAGEVGKDSGPTQQEVIVLAAPKAAIERRLKVLTDVGLTVTGIEPGTHAFFRPFDRFLQRSSDETQANTFVDLGHRGARVIISRGREIVFLKSCPLGGAAFDRAIADRLRLSQTEAGALRRRSWTGDDLGDSGVDPAAIDEAVRPIVEQLGKEISLCLRYFGVTFRGERPESVTCAGSEAVYAPLLKGLEDAAHLPFRPGHALRGIEGGTTFDAAAMETGLPAWTTAAGLALRPRNGVQGSVRAA